MTCRDRVIWRCKSITLLEVTLMTALQLRLGASQVTQASVNTSQSFPSSWSFGKINPDSTNLVGFEYQPLHNPRPGCYLISGFINDGICGKKEAAVQDYGSGKYNKKMCAPNAKNVSGMRESFEALVSKFTFEQCLEQLLGSTIPNDCQQLTGPQGPAVFNIVRMLTDRRALLPDCCLVRVPSVDVVQKYGKVPEDPDKDCPCTPLSGQAIELTPYCKDYCCCSEAISLISPERPYAEREQERLQALQQFLALQQELRLVVQDECCDSILFNQCNSISDCTDKSTESGFVDNVAAFPMCCEYCYDRYDKRCSFKVPGLEIEGGDPIPETTISMRSKTYFPRLQDLCRNKMLCRDHYPCSFSGVKALAVPEMSQVITMSLLGQTLLFAMLR